MTFRRFDMAIMSLISRLVIARGFSQTTPTPASRHCSTSLAWVLCGVITATRSSPARRSMSPTRL